MRLPRNLPKKKEGDITRHLFILGIPALIVCITAAARHRTYDMGQIIIEDIWCGSVKFAAEIERTRHVLDGFKLELE